MDFTAFFTIPIKTVTIESVDADEETQVLTIHEDGTISFRSDAFCTDTPGIISHITKTIAKENIDYIFQSLQTFLNTTNLDTDWRRETDIGSWRLSIINAEGDELSFQGGLYPHYEDLVSLSTYLRKSIHYSDLLAFDGQAVEDKIETLELLYRRSTPVYIPLLYTPVAESTAEERLCIDRQKETLTLTRKLQQSVDITQSYHIEKGISQLLDTIDIHELEMEIRALDEEKDILPVENAEKKEYTLVITFTYGETLRLNGIFDSVGLPQSYRTISKQIKTFLQGYGLGEILNKHVYGKGRKRKGDLIFCGVTFQHSGTVYTYLTKDDTLCEGDTVIVPTGWKNQETTAKIERIQYLPPQDAPYPLDKIKYILRKKS